MKKVIIVCLAAVMILSLCPTQSEAKVQREPGGIPAFLIGCCWGIRVGTEWNDGADLHWREWCRLIPWVNLVIGVWDGVDCYSGMGAEEWAAKNGANWY